MGEPRLSSGGEAAVRFAGVAAGIAILLALLPFLLGVGAATVTLDAHGGQRVLTSLALWYAALLATFVYAVFGSRPLYGAAGFALLLGSLILLFIASTSNG